MALQPMDGALLYTVDNLTIWVGTPGRGVGVGGSFTTVSGTPSQQLLASTNLTLGYGNGQMLAWAAGNGSGRFAGLTAGALINFDPTSTDTGQAVWNRYIIVDPGLNLFLPLIDSETGDPFVYGGVLNCATNLRGWEIRRQFLYAGITPEADIDVVKTAVSAAGCQQSQIMNSSGSYEVIFAY